jgi:hypothetical protein
MRLLKMFVRLAVPAICAAACAVHEPPPAKTTEPAASADATTTVVVESPPAPAPAEAAGAAESKPAAAPPTPTAAPERSTAAPADGAYPGFRVPAFKTTVRRPSSKGATSEPFDSRATKTATLYVVNSTSCPYCANYVDRMKALETKYMPVGVDVVHVYPNRAEPAEEKTQWHAQNAFRGGQILDSDASIAKALEADRTPTVYLVSDKGVIVYRGAIDDNAFPKNGAAPKTWAADAIEAHLAGRRIDPDTTEPEG